MVTTVTVAGLVVVVVAAVAAAVGCCRDTASSRRTETGDYICVVARGRRGRDALVNYTLTRADNRNAWHTQCGARTPVRSPSARDAGVFMRPVSPALSAAPVNYR